MHATTLLTIVAVLLGIASATQLISWYCGRRLTAQLCWALGFFFSLVSSVTLLARPALNPTLSAFLFIFAQWMTAFCLLHGMRNYLELPYSRWGHALFGALLFALAALVLVGTTSGPGWRIMAASLVTGSLFLLAAHTLARGGMREYPARYFFALPCALHGLVVLSRVGMVALGGDAAVNTSVADNLMSLLILEGMIALLIMAFGTHMLVSESVIRDLRNLAEMDALTNSFNRRAFNKILAQAVNAASRREGTFSLLIMDLDHFKQINDNHGHGTGDDALRHFAGIASRCLRTEDVLGRIGGEEFAVYLPAAGQADALLIAERLRSQLAAQPLPHLPADIPLTVSIGVAQYQPGEPLEATLSRADVAMYRAKREGRNRVRYLEASAPSVAPKRLGEAIAPGA